MKKIIFLDIDGVMESHRPVKRSWFSFSKKPTEDEFGPLYDEEAVETLKEVIDQTGAKIVISSSYRNRDGNYFYRLWKKRRLPGEVIGGTPFVTDPDFFDYCGFEDLNEANMNNKAMEVKVWLAKNADLDTRYVIIDDNENWLDEQRPYVVVTSWQTGLTKDKAMSIINILNN